VRKTPEMVMAEIVKTFSHLEMELSESELLHYYEILSSRYCNGDEVKGECVLENLIRANYVEKNGETLILTRNGKRMCKECFKYEEERKFEKELKRIANIQEPSLIERIKQYLKS